MSSISARRQQFSSLHEKGCFVMPNPWDIGTAMMLKSLGFPALATTSAGYAFSRGLPDAEGAVTLEDMLAHIAEIVAATDLPINADFESGYAVAPEQVARNVQRCAETGVAGLSIEDNANDADAPLFELPLATERIAASAEALRGSGVLLTARCEAHLLGIPNAQEIVIERLTAYARAGADVLFAPGLTTAEHIAEVVRAVAPKPVNIILAGAWGLSVEDVAALGGRRISVGSAFARAAWGGFMNIAREVAERGTFNSLADAEPFATLNDFFHAQGHPHG